jgi:acyl carrier protein
MDKKISKEEMFIERARNFLREVLGKDNVDIDVDDDLIGTGILDSLSLLSFLFFIEETRGEELPDIPDMYNGFTLRSAYGLVTKEEIG